MALIGAIAITLLLGYFFFAASMFALMTFGGFDEVSIPAGIVFTIIAIGIAYLWWVLVGEHISIKIAV